MKDNERENLILWYDTLCNNLKIASDLYDIEAKIDSNISYHENQEIIENDLKILSENGTLLKQQQQRNEELKQQQAVEETPSFSIDLDLTDSIAIVGDRHSGKTNLAFFFMNKYAGSRNKFLYGYPKKMKGYKSISTWTDLLRMKDSIIFIDEIQRYIKLYDQRANIELMELLSFLKHQNNTLLFTTQLSQFITKGVEASIKTWCIKQLDVESLKNGCKIKRILKQTGNPKITMKGMDLGINEFITFDYHMPIGFSGLHTFEDQNVGKDWRQPEQKKTSFISKLF